MSFAPRQDPLDQVLERDIDLLLLEELHCNPNFARFLAARLLAKGNRMRFSAAWNSVSEESLGESDLIAVYQGQGHRVGLLLENKIRAPFMPDQAQRYRLRGKEGIRKDWWNAFTTCLLAPRSYLDSDLGGHVFDAYLAYEEIILFFRRPLAGRRGTWRARVLEQAIAGAKGTPYVMQPDAATTRFLKQYWQLANKEFPELHMPAPGDRPRGGVWIFFPVDLPKGISLVHKASVGYSVDLSFARTRAEDLSAAIDADIEPTMYVQQTGKSAVIRIETPTLEPAKDFEQQREDVRTGLGAARALLHFYRMRARQLKWPITSAPGSPSEGSKGQSENQLGYRL